MVLSHQPRRSSKTTAAVTSWATPSRKFQLPEFERYLDPYPDGLPPEIQAQLARITLWGMHDGMSWKNGYPVPNRTNYPLLFDRDRKPKPAFDAVMEVAASADR